jgi:threonine 3-dehydrogenase
MLLSRHIPIAQERFVLALSQVTPCDGGIAMVQVDPIEPGPGEVRLRVGAAGICGTDLQVVRWSDRYAARVKTPRVLGHEVCGTIDSVGPGVTALAGGDRVSLESHIWCGHCRTCRLEQLHLCEATTYPGIDIDGGFAEYITVPERIAWKIPATMPFAVGALLEPFGIAVHAAGEGAGVAGRSVLINGCGAIGLMAIAVARALGATRIIGADIDDARLALARDAGSDATVNVSRDSLAEAVRECTGHAGADVVIETTAVAAGFASAFANVARGGDIRLVGTPEGLTNFSFTGWLANRPTVYSIHGRRIWSTWQRATELLATGAVDLNFLLHEQMALADGVRAFELLRERRLTKAILMCS